MNIFKRIKRWRDRKKADKILKSISSRLARGCEALRFCENMLDKCNVPRQARREFWNRFARHDHPAQFISEFIRGCGVK